MKILVDYLYLSSHSNFTSGVTDSVEVMLLGELWNKKKSDEAKEEAKKLLLQKDKFKQGILYITGASPCS